MKRRLVILASVFAVPVLALVVILPGRTWAAGERRWRSGEFYALTVWPTLLQYAQYRGRYPPSLAALEEEEYWIGMPKRPDVAYHAAGLAPDDASPFGRLLVEETRDDLYAPYRRGRFVVFGVCACWVPSGGRPGTVGLTDLHAAAFAGRMALVAKLVAQREVDPKAYHDWTPLHGAAFYGHEDVVEVLVRAGADVNAKDTAGRTPLSLAEAAGHGTVVQLLAAHGARR